MPWLLGCDNPSENEPVRPPDVGADGTLFGPVDSKPGMELSCAALGRRNRRWIATKRPVHSIFPALMRLALTRISHTGDLAA